MFLLIVSENRDGISMKEKKEYVSQNRTDCRRSAKVVIFLKLHWYDKFYFYTSWSDESCRYDSSVFQETQEEILP